MQSWIETVISGLGYMGIALLMFLENIFPPIPSELIVPMAGFATSEGEMSLALIVLAGTIGSMIGQLPLYFVGKKVGEDRLMQWVDRYGGWIAITWDDVERAERWFAKHDSLTVLIARFIPGIRTWISVPAGLCQMSLARFLFYSTIGMTIWILILAFLGRLFGEHYARVEQYLGSFSYIVLAGVLLAVAGWIWRRRRMQTERTKADTL